MQPVHAADTSRCQKSYSPMEVIAPSSQVLACLLVSLPINLVSSFLCSPPLMTCLSCCPLELPVSVKGSTPHVPFTCPCLPLKQPMESIYQSILGPPPPPRASPPLSCALHASLPASQVAYGACLPVMLESSSLSCMLCFAFQAAQQACSPVSQCENVVVKTIVYVGLTGMHKTGCSGETRLFLHVPSSS